MIIRQLIIALGALALAMVACGAARAHSQSYAFLSADRDGGGLHGRLELAVRDLDTLFALDADGDGRITWGELRRREADVIAGALSGLAFATTGGACRIAGEPVLVDRRGGEAYAVIGFAGTCPDKTGEMSIGYNLMFDRDAQHRALVSVTDGGATRSIVLGPEQRRFATAAGPGNAFVAFLGHGFHHILIGYDHILFVLTLLLGSAATAAGWRPAAAACARVVTAFTLAHSLTLGLAAAGVVALPQALTESLIAVTIVLAAANNIYPLVTRRIWLVAGAFGLVHGLGFATVLADLALPTGNLLVALLAFNGGVELGQLAIVAVALPALILFGAVGSAGRPMLRSANALIAAIGLAWFADRAAGLQLLPF